MFRYLDVQGLTNQAVDALAERGLDAAAVLYDTIVRFLRLGLRTVLVLGLVVAAGAFFSGQSVTAVRARQGLTGAIGWVAGGAERAGFSTGPVGAWVYANKRALRIGAVTLAALALVFWGRPPARSCSASPWRCWPPSPYRIPRAAAGSGPVEVSTGQP